MESSLRLRRVLPVLLLLAACDDPSAPPQPPPPQPPPPLAAARVAAPAALSAPAPTALAEERRAVERRIFLVLAVPEADLAGTVRAHAEACVPPDCEVVEVAVSRSGGAAEQSGSLGLRIVPEALPGFLERVTAAGEVLERQETAQDLTAPTLDAEARLETQRMLLARLRSRIEGRADLPLADLLAWEREMARVQGEIEAREAQVRALARRTGRVAVQVSYRGTALPRLPRWLEPVERAVMQAPVLLGASAGALVSLAVVSLPWLPPLGLAALLIRRAWRRRQARRAVSPGG